MEISTSRCDSEAACLESPEEALTRGRNIGDKAVEELPYAGP